MGLVIYIYIYKTTQHNYGVGFNVSPIIKASPISIVSNTKICIHVTLLNDLVFFFLSFFLFFHIST